MKLFTQKGNFSCPWFIFGNHILNFTDYVGNILMDESKFGQNQNEENFFKFDSKKYS